MSTLGSQIIFKQLLQRHGHIRIPMIQRDYAQGRPSEAEVREEFLTALAGALLKPADDPTLPLNLDFIYGSVEGDEETRFMPLDGQQRLTTLFLLHWYLAWKDQRWAEFGKMFRADAHARFSYSVRPSSTEFFDALVVFEPSLPPEKVSSVSHHISNQPWYFRSWRLDPTIQSSLAMLDAIHQRFVLSSGLFARIINDDRPAITFQLLNLDNFGLSDDLYIKMNARGKPLTPFETFKARYEQELEKQFADEQFKIGGASFSVTEFVARRLDTTWADLFWAHRNRATNSYDDAMMNLFRAVALITRNPESSSYSEDIQTLRNGYRPASYADFHSRGWLDRPFTNTLIRLLETWSSGGGTLTVLLTSQRYFDENGIFNKLAASGAALSYVEIVQLAAYAFLIRTHPDKLDPQKFLEWMRVVYNLSVNTSYDRPSDLQRSISGLASMESESGDILAYLASTDKPPGGFSEQQVAEEIMKAQLLRGHEEWRTLIERAENHPYFKGQIEFLLEFCGAVEKSRSNEVAKWDSSAHLSLQQSFASYLQKAEVMFGEQGLSPLRDFRWQRALLSLGNYLLPSGRNVSFLVNGATEQASWKRLLRGTGPSVPEARKLLHSLIDRLDVNQPLAEQLDAIIKEAKNLEPWREAIVRSPEAIKFCDNRSVRWNKADEIYLLKKSQMNGSHAELFTFCFYHQSVVSLEQQGHLRPFASISYQATIGTDSEPHILLILRPEKRRVDFKIEFRNGLFVILVDLASLAELPALDQLLCGPTGFSKGEACLSKESAPENLVNELLDIAKILAVNMPPPANSP